MRDVGIGRWFVEQQQPPFLRQCPRQHYALPLSGLEFIEISPTELRGVSVAQSLHRHIHVVR